MNKIGFLLLLFLAVQSSGQVDWTNLNPGEIISVQYGQSSLQGWLHKEIIISRNDNAYDASYIVYSFGHYWKGNAFWPNGEELGFDLNENVLKASEIVQSDTLRLITNFSIDPDQVQKALICIKELSLLSSNPNIQSSNNHYYVLKKTGNDKLIKYDRGGRFKKYIELKKILGFP